MAAWIAAAQPPVKVQGRVNRGQEFRKEIGSELVLVLRPTEAGWEIQVKPLRGPAQQGCEDFVWVATPPYRSSNPRYVDTSYGITAAEAVKWSPRGFQFVLNLADCKAEAARVDRVLWPYNYSDKEVVDAQAKLGTSPLGKGELRILDSKISGQQIDWIQFAVELTVPVKR